MIDGVLTPDLNADRVFGQVSVGRGTYLCGVKFKIYTPNEKIIIGRYCSLASGITITASGNHRHELPSTWPFDNFIHELPNPTRTYRELDRHTTIGNDVWIGDQAIIGGGIQVGHGAVIGAGAVVFRDVPPYAVVVGNPAKAIKNRFSEKQIDELLKLRWWDWDPATIHRRLDWFYLPVDEFIKNGVLGE